MYVENLKGLNIHKGDFKMSEKILNENICLKQYISEKEYMISEVKDMEKKL